MLIVSDVHGASAALRRVASMGEPLLVLGDLINYIDYRTNEGIVADVSGQELVDEFVSIRGAEGHEAASEIWHRHWVGREAELRERYGPVVGEVLALKSKSCRYPTGDPKTDDFHFCGKTVYEDYTYCETHMGIVVDWYKMTAMKARRARNMTGKGSGGVIFNR